MMGAARTRSGIDSPASLRGSSRQRSRVPRPRSRRLRRGVRMHAGQVPGQPAPRRERGRGRHERTRRSATAAAARASANLAAAQAWPERARKAAERRVQSEHGGISECGRSDGADQGGEVPAGEDGQAVAQNASRADCSSTGNAIAVDSSITSELRAVAASPQVQRRSERRPYSVLRDPSTAPRTLQSGVPAGHPTPTSANCDAPVKMSSDVPQAWTMDSPLVVAMAPKDRPYAPTAMPTPRASRTIDRRASVQSEGGAVTGSVAAGETHRRFQSANRSEVPCVPRPAGCGSALCGWTSSRRFPHPVRGQAAMAQQVDARMILGYAAGTSLHTIARSRSRLAQAVDDATAAVSRVVENGSAIPLDLVRRRLVVAVATSKPSASMCSTVRTRRRVALIAPCVRLVRRFVGGKTTSR